MEWNPERNPVQLLASKYPAATLVGASAARGAAELAAKHGRTVPDAAIARAVEHYASLLRTAIGFTRERRHAAEPEE